MEQARKDKDQAQAEEWAEAGVAPPVEVEVLVQDLVEIASAPVVVNEQCINWEFPAMSKNAQNAARL
jgi:hypothetical protein